MEKCNLCEKDVKNFYERVWYHSKSPETILCRSCNTKWTKTKECKELKEKYKDVKPTTKLWKKKCKEQQETFDRWYYANGGTDEE